MAVHTAAFFFLHTLLKRVMAARHDRVQSPRCWRIRTAWLAAQQRRGLESARWRKWR